MSRTASVFAADPARSLVLELRPVAIAPLREPAPRRIWSVVLDLATGALGLAYVSSEVARGFRPRAIVQRAASEASAFVAEVPARDRAEAIAIARALLDRYLVDGVLPLGGRHESDKEKRGSPTAPNGR